MISNIFKFYFYTIFFSVIIGIIIGQYTAVQGYTGVGILIEETINKIAEAI